MKGGQGKPTVPHVEKSRPPWRGDEKSRIPLLAPRDPDQKSAQVM